MACIAPAGIAGPLDLLRIALPVRWSWPAPGARDRVSVSCSTTQLKQFTALAATCQSVIPDTCFLKCLAYAPLISDM